jgi:hypothetical protein
VVLKRLHDEPAFAGLLICHLLRHTRYSPTNR